MKSKFVKFFKYLIVTLLTLLVIFMLSHQIVYWQQKPNSREGTIGANAMVVSAHPLASEIGNKILKQGGNAYDAAIAVNFALAVVYQQAGNIGGGGFMVHRQTDGSVGSIDFREKAPIAAHQDMYLDEKGDVISGLSQEGHLAVGVPGTVDGMVQIHSKFATMNWADLVAPAIGLAEKGFKLTSQGAGSLNSSYGSFEDNNHKEITVLAQDKWEEGNHITFPDLANTLKLISINGREGFYGGSVADKIVAEMIKSDGLITHEDLNRYSAVWREAIETSYKGHKVITMPLPSSGGVSLVQLLKGAEQIDMAQWDHNSTSHIHYMTELQRRAYADRAEWLGDPDFVEVDVARLTSPDYIQNRNSDIDAQNKTDSQDIKPGAVSTIESFETTHFSIVDKWRNAVSITTTLNGMFGSKVVVDGAGFFLNNEMDDFSVKAGVANQFGLVGNEKNSIQPEKRMLSSMSPTILEKDGELFMVVGSPGGSTIITVVYQSISNVIDYGMSMQEAVDAKKTHSQWLPDVVVLEKGSTNLSTLGNLISKGHVPIPWPMFPLGLGRVNAILVKDDGSLEGAADDRAEDNFAAGH
ncbi:MAG: gamma-glutamyltransferase [Sphingomonadales bacterium]|jgi:gamma-glutamyltranspeptidase/glutathione hydrolase|tara:strand:- start:2289 stop:4034 length:1746 start_codon:yes stop_codon:yes gene_type:complete